MKLTVILNPENRHRNALFFGNRMVANGTSGLEDVSIQWKDNKRAVLHLTLSNFNLVVQNDKCPEADRYNEVVAAFGDRARIGALNPVCEMLRISPSACDGCPKNPNKSTAAN